MAIGEYESVSVVDARDELHLKCECVPDLGPAHCHKCSGGSFVSRLTPWERCVENHSTIAVGYEDAISVVSREMHAVLEEPHSAQRSDTIAVYRHLLSALRSSRPASA